MGNVKRTFVGFVVAYSILPICAHAQQSLGSLTDLVRDFSAAHIESLKNIRCAVESTDPNGVKFHGQIAIMNGVLPYKFPPRGAFLFSRSPAADSPNDNNSVSMKIGNSQYSFKLKKQSQSQSYSLVDVVIPTDDPNREDLARDKIFFSFSSTDAEAIWSPIRVFDLASIDMLSGDRGIQIVNFQYSPTERRAIVDFDFPKEHPFKHEWARVIFGDRGEVLEYEIRNRSRPDILDTYFVKINYQQLDQALDGSNYANEAALFPSEFRVRSLTKRNGQLLSESPEVSVRLSNFEYDKIDLGQFTLTQYGIPEPEGTTVLKRPVPYWLLGTIAGGVFVVIGIYLRRNADGATLE